MLHKLRASIMSLMRRRYFVVSTCATLCAVGLFLFVSPIYAQVEFLGNFIGEVVHWVCGQIILPLLVMLITLVLNFLISVVLPWQVFTTAPAVEAGWIICRDVANMFFAIILIVIAVGTILNIDRYHYKNWLTRLVLMIVLVNFSKTICGIIIDFSQVVMLTFSAAVVEAGVGNFMQAIGLLDLQSLVANANVNKINVAINDVLAVIFATIALCVFVGMTVMLLFRVFMLWILIILSPFAYLGSTFDRGKAMHGQWWEKFISNVVAGPVLALFIYLTLTTVSETNALIGAKAGEGLGPGVNVGVGTISNPQVFSGFMVGIGMLIAGMMITQEVGGASGAAFSFGYEKAMGAAKGAGRFAGGFALARLGDLSRVTGLSRLGAAALKRVQKGAEFAGGYEGKGVLGRVGATILAATGGRAAAGAIGRGLKGFEHEQVEEAKHELEGYSTNQLKIAARQGGLRGQAAEELLLKDENLKELRKDPSNRAFMKQLFKHAQEHGLDVDKVEDKYKGFFDAEAKVKEIREASDARKLSTKDLEDSVFVEELQKNALALNKFKDGFFEKKSKVKVKDANGNIVSVDLGAGSAYVNDNDEAINLTMADIEEKGAVGSGKWELKAGKLKELDARSGQMNLAELLEQKVEFKGNAEQLESLNKGLAKAQGKDIIGKNFLALSKDLTTGGTTVKGYDRLLGQGSPVTPSQIESIILNNKTSEDKKVRSTLFNAIAEKIASNLAKGPDAAPRDRAGHLDVYAGIAPDIQKVLKGSMIAKDAIEKEVKDILQKKSQSEAIERGSIEENLLKVSRALESGSNMLQTVKAQVGVTENSGVDNLVNALLAASNDQQKVDAVNAYNAEVLRQNKVELRIDANDFRLNNPQNVSQVVNQIVKEKSEGVKKEAESFEKIVGLLEKLKDAKQRKSAISSMKKMPVGDLTFRKVNVNVDNIVKDMSGQISEQQIAKMIDTQIDALKGQISPESDLHKFKEALEKTGHNAEEYRHEAEKFLKKEEGGGGH